MMRNRLKNIIGHKSPILFFFFKQKRSDIPPLITQNFLRLAVIYLKAFLSDSFPIIQLRADTLWLSNSHLSHSLRLWSTDISCRDFFSPLLRAWWEQTAGWKTTANYSSRQLVCFLCICCCRTEPKVEHCQWFLANVQLRLVWAFCAGIKGSELVWWWMLCMPFGMSWKPYPVCLGPTWFSNGSLILLREASCGEKEAERKNNKQGPLSCSAAAWETLITVVKSCSPQLK